MRTAFRIAALTLAIRWPLPAPPTRSSRSPTPWSRSRPRPTRSPTTAPRSSPFTLTIDKGWHLYANPVGNPDYVDNQVTVTLSSKTKLQDVKVEYPAGTVVKDKTVGDYRIYEGTVTIKATVHATRATPEPWTRPSSCRRAAKRPACSGRP